MKRVFNFSPGPAMLPEPVLRKAQAELLDWQGSGMSVMEVSHRGTDFIEFAARSERTLRKLLGVPDNYKVLFLQGGATLQFAAVPLNLAPVCRLVRRSGLIEPELVSMIAGSTVRGTIYPPLASVSDIARSSDCTSAATR